MHTGRDLDIHQNDNLLTLCSIPVLCWQVRPFVPPFHHQTAQSAMLFKSIRPTRGSGLRLESHGLGNEFNRFRRHFTYYGDAVITQLTPKGTYRADT